MSPFLKNKRALVLTAILVLILLASILALIFINGSSKTGKIAEITQDGKVIKTIQLDTVTKAYTFQVDGPNGVYNIIEVRPGEIGIQEASCPDRLCIHMGFIHSTGVPITCLPNKLVIRILSEDASAQGPDEVSF